MLKPYAYIGTGPCQGKDDTGMRKDDGGGGDKDQMRAGREPWKNEGGDRGRKRIRQRLRTEESGMGPRHSEGADRGRTRVGRGPRQSEDWTEIETG